MNMQDAPAERPPTSMMIAESMETPSSKPMQSPKVKAAIITQALPPVTVLRMQPTTNTLYNKP